MSVPVTQDEVRRTADELDQLAATVVAATSGLAPSPVPATAGRVAIATADRGAFMAAVLGTWRSGGVAVPLGEAVPQTGSVEHERLRYRLELTQPSLVLADNAHNDLMADAGYHRQGSVDGQAFDLWQASAVREISTPDDSAVIMFTSGSSGTPKGVVISHAALATIAATNREVYRLTADDCFLSALPMTHMAGLTNLLAATEAGAEIVVAPPAAFANRVHRVIEERRVSVAGLVPHQLHQLFAKPGTSDLSSLRLVVSSGTHLSAAVIEATSRALPGADLVNAYGLTEAFRSFAVSVQSDDPAAIGLPVLGVGARLVDPETGRSAERGQIGEVHLQGDNLYSGYLTADGGVEPAPRWFATGDMAVRTADNQFRLVGRQASFINIGGHKESVESIEAVLDGAAPGRLAVVGGIDDQGLERLVVVAEAGAGVELRDLRRRCAGRLSASLRPAALIEVECLPRTGLGKVDRLALSELVSSGGHPDGEPQTAPIEDNNRQQQSKATCEGAGPMPETKFNDFIVDFSDEYAAQYVVRRPEYPAALFDWLTEQSSGTEHAWDSGTGTGELAIPLADRFERVTASDGNADMLATARRHPKVSYHHWASEEPDLADNSVDLAVSGMAMHWFDDNTFYPQVERVLRPGGLLAAIGFYFFDVDNGIGDMVKNWYHDHMTGYESPQLVVLRQQYEALKFPYEAIEMPAFTMTESWTYHQLASFLYHWIVVKQARKAGVDALAELLPQIAARWPGDPDTEATVTWPIFGRVARPVG